MVRQNEFRGRNLADVVRKATADYEKKRQYKEQKQIAEVWAPPLFWGPWVGIFTQFGVVGPDSDKHVTKLDVSFTGITGSSSFSVEIKGGDELIRAIGPGSAEVTITGNVATTISMRAKSHSTGFGVDVNVR
jgi:hypothetical protein